MWENQNDISFYLADSHSAFCFLAGDTANSSRLPWKKEHFIVCDSSASWDRLNNHDGETLKKGDKDKVTFCEQV